MAVRFAVIVAALMLLTPVRLFAQGRPAPLQGVDTVTVEVSIAAPPDILPHGLTEKRLKTMVELKLRGWGLLVISEADGGVTFGGGDAHEMGGPTGVVAKIRAARRAVSDAFKA